MCKDKDIESLQIYEKKEKKKVNVQKLYVKITLIFFQINMFCNFENKYDHLKLGLRNVK